MDFLELVKLAWQGITTNRLRSSLTILGIVIGIAAVIVLLAIGEGAKLDTEKQIKALGSNVLFVFAGAAQSGAVALKRGTYPTVTWDDAIAIQKTCPAVSKVVPILQDYQQVQRNGQNANTMVIATTPDYTVVRNHEVERGRNFNDADMDHLAKVCLLGTTVATSLFGKDDPIGKKILIRSELFNVIGVMEEKGSSQFRDMDDQILIPLTTGYDRIFGYNGYSGKMIHFMVVSAKDEAEISPALFQIRNLMRIRHQIIPPMADDFMVRTQQEMLAASQEITAIFTILLGSTGSIALLVGGIGIMNIMLVSVAERTREIGIRKALGARHGDIMKQFIIEATVLSLSGGLIGIAFGIGSALLISHFAEWTTVISPIAVSLSFGVSIIVGLFFGIYPARQAAKLDPITALRSE
jgi:putative ABC transport system permease protein